MIADQMRKLHAFNRWAWERVYASVAELDGAAYHARRLLFEGSIHGTLVHGMTAEYIWLSRIKGVSPSSMLDPRDYGDFTAVRTAWQPLADEWGALMSEISDEDCPRVVDYRNTRGGDFSLALVDILQHVVNHATEHRSQLTPILYDLGVPTQPLDYMLYMLSF